MTSTVFARARWASGLCVGLTGLAMLAYPGGTALDASSSGYSFFQNFLSDLGSTVTYGGRPNTIGAILFVLSLGIMVLALGGCLVGLVRLHSGSIGSRYLALAAGAVGAVVCASFIGVALTPEDRFMDLHIKFSFLAFRTFPLVTLLFALATLRDDNFPRRATVAWLALTIVLAGYVAVLQWGPQIGADGGLTIQVTAQKTVAFAVVIILLYLSYEAEHVRRRLQPTSDTYRATQGSGTNSQ